MGVLLGLLSNCVKGYKDIPVVLEVGQIYQGGIIAYILQEGDSGYNAEVQHGLIAAPYDQSTGIDWDNGSNLTTRASGTKLGTGNPNTKNIVSIKGEGNYAAKLCYDLTLGSFNDWYLPSKDELNLLFLIKEVVGGFAPVPYWSSTGATSNYAWHECFSNGYQSNTNMGNFYHVRAVRAF